MNSIKGIVEELVKTERSGKLRGLTVVTDVDGSPTVQVYIGVQSSPSSLAWLVAGVKLLDSRLLSLLESLCSPDDELVN